MAVSRQTVAQTLADAVSWRPVLGPVLRAFEPLLSAQAELAETLAQTLAKKAAAGPALPEWRADRAGQGLSLLSGVKLAGGAGLLRASAEKLLPLLGAMEAMAPHMPALEAFFLGQREEPSAAPEDSREALAEALIANDRKAVARIAENAGLEPPVLGFVAGFVTTPVLRAITRALCGAGQGPWNEGEFWQRGYCPVCGSLPSIAWLDKPVADDKNAYLAGGGGKKHLHCGLCGADWRFRRGACPACEEEGGGVIEILRESGPSHGERLDWCTKCKSYCPTVDLREREFTPDLEAAAIGMMHLDMVAARKKLRPLALSFWNMV